MALSRRWFLAGLAAASVATAGVSADARMHAPYRGHRIIPANAAPLDGFTTPSGAYSFRKLRSTYAGPAIRIRRTGDNAETDINFLGCTGFTGCPWDEAAAASFCAAVSCFGVTWYDQSGAARHLTQAAFAAQPALVFGCQGGLPCLRTTELADTLVSAGTLTPATGNMSISAVGRRSSGTLGCRWAHPNGGTNRFQANTVANSWILIGGTSGNIPAASSDAAMHAGIGIINTASSLLSIDGTETTGSVTGSVTAGAVALRGEAAVSCDHAEMVIWDNYVLTAGERTALIGNQRSFWGF